MYVDCNFLSIMYSIISDAGNPLVYVDCNLGTFDVVKRDATGNPLVYVDCNLMLLTALLIM